MSRFARQLIDDKRKEHSEQNTKGSLGRRADFLTLVVEANTKANLSPGQELSDQTIIDAHQQPHCPRDLWHAYLETGGRWIVPACIVNILSVFVLGDGTYFAVEGLRVNNMVQVHHFSWSFYAGFGAEVVADAIITISQCLLLVRMRTGLERTDSIISLMMKYSINTGLLTSICAILVLVTYESAQPTNFIYFTFYFVYSKLYVNSLLATLNARRSRLMQYVLDRPQASARSIMNIEFKAGELVATNQTQVHQGQSEIVKV
ncbi:hypothetical protein GY45DRAFT_1375938 [Cubamyces sp. BRFM 1775]|nr:hypothetical protein GY45DRAFT_1375938 [Cubamyces sp. BRFM 1775]